MSKLQAALSTLAPARLQGIRRGIEKESLRATPAGALALTPHPTALGSALTHPNITTDYSESQLELITGVHASVEQCLEELTQVHQFTYRALGDEMLWVSSMPCSLPADENIPIGRYGASNVGRAKSVYRMGLAHRYGRRMQTISGIHYNWSLPGVSDPEYFGLIRNFRRHAFLLLYLFGASPAACSTFVAGRKHELQTLSPGTVYMPYGTSLRMGRLGYQSEAQASLAVSYNSLEGYAASLHEALTKPYPAYEKVGITNPGGEYNQLATTLLQIENEFYGTIRPKRVIRPGERPLHALRERGVEYVEVRLMDLDPFVPVGIKAQTMRFLDIFLLHCLLADSPQDTPQEIAALGRNQHRTAAYGRDPAAMLERQGREVKLTDWGGEIVAECAPIAALLDEVHGTTDYGDALRAAEALLHNPDMLPSARVLAAMAREHDNSFAQFTRAQSELAKAKLLRLPWTGGLQAKMEALASQSIQDQAEVEAADTMPFEQYRQQYVSPERLGLTQAAVAPALAAV
ncbi:glutamate--cysteine ligase [Ramlibacter sp. USB13]|uniref:Glutamate--cysteine ligase n=1 Tax=Ramlibacter cellulosilyticus TaxID=2764187 RepID=A0A923S9W4_9BURK|nr:glutamate--cysteine ligase [Ramlibacter cellulosilyticus]MBC5782096.1 glutamate--cysteine ligase [Ramlibacter cellulosilyticus]